jgi:hypothetical protein
MRNTFHLLAIVILLSTTLFASKAAAMWNAEAPRSGISISVAAEESARITELNFSWTIYRAAGDSMHPHYGANSLLIVNKVSISDLRKGMIVLYRDHEGDVVGHSVAAMDESGIRAKGTYTDKLDPTPITSENLIGVVLGVMHANSESNALSEKPLALGKRY